MQPYADSLAHLQAELDRLDLILRLHIERLGGDTEESESALDSMYVSEEEVRDLLKGARETTATDEKLRTRIDERTEQLQNRVSASLRQGNRLRFAAMAERFGLSRRQLDALLFALAPELDEKYTKIVGFLRDDAMTTRPTVGLAGRVFGHTDRDRLDRFSMFSGSSPLIDHGLVSLHPDSPEVPRLARTVSADRWLIEYLYGSQELSTAIIDFATLQGSASEMATLTLAPESRNRLETVVEAANQEPTVYYIHGPKGSGRADVAESIATAVGVPRICVDFYGQDDRQIGTIIPKLRREAVLRDAALQFNLGDTPGSDEETVADDLLRRLDAFDGQIFLTGSDSWTPTRRLPHHEFVSLAIERPSYPLRKEIWTEYTDQLPDTVAPDEIASKFSLTPGQIEDALFTATAFSPGDGLTREAVYRGCRAQASANLSEHARKTDPSHDWADIVLPDDKHQQLREVAAHVNHRGTVYDDWGFGEQSGLGNGLVVLFTGPSGTGKTMAADIIANNAGLDLYKIDIASVVSKYIGETESNLGRIFDEAQHSNAILFFDEADALFGQRSEVSDAQDRYANVEVNYLLQRIEEHDGTVVLTTNFEQNIDDAFQRRLDIRVDFPRPSERSRLAIWTEIFPADTPVDDLDFEFLATFDLTGGNIRNIAQTAAFLAAEDSGVVEMKHAVLATKLELQKVGKLLNPSDFSPYRDLLA